MDDVHDVQVFEKEFNASSIDFEVTWWTDHGPSIFGVTRQGYLIAV